jgi:YgiT-type zinc finger domain-containing protein
MKCPYCGEAMAPGSVIFMERGEYDGSRYEEEGNIPTFVCTTCGAEVAEVKEGTVKNEDGLSNAMKTALGSHV